MIECYAIDLIFLDKEAETLIILETPEQVVKWSREHAGKMKEPYLAMTAYPITLH
jgi:hypothetical protein